MMTQLDFCYFGSMRIILIIIAMSSFIGFGQDDSLNLNQAMKNFRTELNKMNHSLDSIQMVHAQKELRYKEEINVLREIMKGYVYMIDSLNTRLQKVEGNPEPEKKSDEINLDHIEVEFKLDAGLEDLITNFDQGVSAFQGTARKPGEFDPPITARELNILVRF